MGMGGMYTKFRVSNLLIIAYLIPRRLESEETGLTECAASSAIDIRKGL